MILTSEGFIEFIPAGDLLREDQQPVFGYFKDGRRYAIVSATLVGPNQVRIDGKIDRPSEGWRRSPRANLTVAATEIIPTIRRSAGEGDQE